jgi:hypothetical protein
VLYGSSFAILQASLNEVCGPSAILMANFIIGIGLAGNFTQILRIIC